MDVRGWLLNKAAEEFVTFDKTDFKQDCEEILTEYVSIDDQDQEMDNRNKIWDLFRNWQRDKEYLCSLNLHRIIAKCIRNSCRDLKLEQTLTSWVKSDSASSDGLAALAGQIVTIIEASMLVKAPLTGDVAYKFSDEMIFHSNENFHLGLENMIGHPPTNADLLISMKREHETAHVFKDHKDCDVDPRVEWNIVMRDDSWNIAGIRYLPTPDIAGRDIKRNLAYYFDRSKDLFRRARGGSGTNFKELNVAEVAALRLWTGPMHKMYAYLLRNPQMPSGPYVTTLHAINSGITKLARIWRLPDNRKVYRGCNGRKLREMKKDEFHCRGGVERSVLATTLDLDVAAQYSGIGAFILEIDVGHVNRGADVHWLSQFPHEKEILFNALSNVEFVSSPQLRFVEDRGTILVYQVCISANVKSKTLDEFYTLRKDLHLNLVEILTQEARRVIIERVDGSMHGLIKKLAYECKNECDEICRKSKEAEIRIFNDGTPTYVELVEGAIMFKSRAMEVIDLALRWFKTLTANPLDIDKLQGWQLQALKKAFKTCERPTVTTIVLEQNRQVNSLFEASALNLGDIHKPESSYKVAKLLNLNPKLANLKMEATAEVWEKIFGELCPGRPSLCVNGFQLAEFAISTLLQLELRNSPAQMAQMVAPALLFFVPSALTSLSLCGSRIACAGAESLGRAFRTSLQFLRYVNLRHCDIGDRGSTGIAQSMSALSELVVLNLARNIVKDDGFNVLASVVIGLQKLKSVDIRYNKTLLPSIHYGSQCVIKNHIVFKHMRCTSFPCVAWNRNGDQIACGSFGHAITLWDAISGHVLSTLSGHTSTVHSIAWSPNGDQIASGGGDNTIIIWDAKAAAWSQVSTLEGHTSYVCSVAWSPDSSQIASASYDKTTIIWNAKSGDKAWILKGHHSAVTSVTWSPDSLKIASGSIDETIIIWNVKDGQQIRTLKGHNQDVNCVMWSPIGDRIVSASSDRSLIMWDVNSDKISILEGHGSEFHSVCWSPDGKKIASVSDDKKMIVWDATLEKKIAEYEIHKSQVRSVAWSPKGDRIVSGSDDTLIIWDAEPEEHDWLLKGHTSWVQCLAWNRNGDLIASGSYDNSIFIWNAKSGDRISTLLGHSSSVQSLAWSPDGNQLVSGSGNPHQVPGNPYQGADKGEIIIWNVKTTSQILKMGGHSAAVMSVTWNIHGDRIASGSHDKKVITWDSGTGEQLYILDGHTSGVSCVAWSPTDDCIASASTDKTIIIWRAKVQLAVLKGHSNFVTSVSWSPDGKRIVSGCGNPYGGGGENEIIIWDVQTFRQESNLKGHSSAVMSVAWNPHIDQIVSGSEDRKVIIWDAKSGAQISVLKGHHIKITCVAWSPSGQQVASASEDETIMIWEGSTGALLSNLAGHESEMSEELDLRTVVTDIGCVPSPSKKKKTH